MAVDFECVTLLRVDPAEAFRMSLDVGLHTDSMAGSGERAIGAIRSGELGLGDEVTWRARHLGVVWSMTSRIIELDPPTRFVDEQTRGPFAAFRHEHLFEAISTGTRMTDRVQFAAPFGPAGRLAEMAALGRYMRRLIRTRNAFLAQQTSR